MFVKRFLAFAALAAACAPVPAQTPGEPLQLFRGRVQVFECKVPDCVMIGAEALAAVANANEQMGRRIAELEAEVAKLKDIKGCAKLTVMPKPAAWKGV